jgi:carbonic anhydrase
MSRILNAVLESNRKYAAALGEKAKLALPPARCFASLACIDACLDPTKYAGLAEGDGHVIRNAGSRAVTQCDPLPRNEFPAGRNAHQTDCGMERSSCVCSPA